MAHDKNVVAFHVFNFRLRVLMMMVAGGCCGPTRPKIRELHLPEDITRTMMPQVKDALATMPERVTVSVGYDKVGSCSYWCMSQKFYNATAFDASSTYTTLTNLMTLVILFDQEDKHNIDSVQRETVFSWRKIGDESTMKGIIKFTKVFCCLKNGENSKGEVMLIITGIADQIITNNALMEFVAPSSSTINFQQSVEKFEKMIENALESQLEEELGARSEFCCPLEKLYIWHMTNPNLLLNPPSLLLLNPSTSSTGASASVDASQPDVPEKESEEHVEEPIQTDSSDGCVAQ